MSSQTPFSKLPTEILRKILSYAAYLYGSGNLHFNRESREVMKTIPLYCQHCRKNVPSICIRKDKTFCHSCHARLSKNHCRKCYAKVPNAKVENVFVDRGHYSLLHRWKMPRVRSSHKNLHAIIVQPKFHSTNRLSWKYIVRALCDACAKSDKVVCVNEHFAEII
jgi:hypothetical protein